MRFLLSLPLLVIPVAAYNILVFFVSGPAGVEGALYDMNQAVYNYVAPSGVTFPITTAELLLACAMLLLYIEIFKATATGKLTSGDQFLSFILMVVCIVELVFLPEMATGTFLLLTLTTIIDVIGGFVVRMRPRKKETPPAPAAA